MDLEEAKNKIGLMRYENERKIGMFFLNLDFELLDCNAVFKDASTNQDIGELDLIFFDSEYVLLIDGSKQKDNSKVASFFAKWSNRNNQEQIFKRYGLTRRKVFRLYQSKFNFKKIT